MLPHCAGLPVDHGEDVLEETEDLEGERRTVNQGVEPDPRATLDSVCDEDWSPGNRVVDDVVVIDHPDGISASLSHQVESQDQVLIGEIAGIGRRDECRVVQRDERRRTSDATGAPEGSGGGSRGRCHVGLGAGRLCPRRSDRGLRTPTAGARQCDGDAQEQ